MCQLWVTPTGLPPHLNLFNVWSPCPKLSGWNHTPCKRGASRCKHMQRSLTREIPVGSVLHTQSPPLRGSTFILSIKHHCSLSSPSSVNLLNLHLPHCPGHWRRCQTGLDPILSPGPLQGQASSWANLWRATVQPVFKSHHCYFFRHDFFSRTVIKSVL